MLEQDGCKNLLIRQNWQSRYCSVQTALWYCRHNFDRQRHIIGNGFDLFHGYETSYSDFYQYLSDEACYGDMLSSLEQYWFNVEDKALPCQRNDAVCALKAP
jgi:hypothetical protein